MKVMKRRSALLLMLLFPFAATAQIKTPHWRGRNVWRHDRPCLSALQPKDDCVDMRDGRRVCRHFVSEEDVDEITVVRDGRVLYRWTIDLGLGGNAEPADFFRADLDGDGAPEVILPTLEAVSNGYAIRTVRIDVIDGRDAASPPLHFEVQDFDRQVSFLRAPGGKQCRVFATEWLWTIDTKRDAGNYLAGQWLDYHAARLRHTTSRPVLARRRLYSFDRAMERGTMYDWLRDSHTEALVAAPPQDDRWDPKSKILPAVLQSIREGKVDVRIGSSEQSLDLDSVRMIDDRTRRLFPAAYDPVSEALAGRPIVIRATGWPPEKYSTVLIHLGHASDVH